MADMFFDVNAALTEVPVNLMPLLSDSDFKTRQTSVAYNAAGMDLVWNFVTSAGAFTQTAVTPTTGGNYDWTNQGGGMYSIEIPSTGGASINNNTAGYGWFTGVATGILSWRSPIIGFRAAATNDALMDGGDTLDVNVATLDSAAVAAIWNEVVDGTYTARQMSRVIMAVLGGQASGLGTTTALYKNRDGSKTRVTATVDSDGNRSSITFTDLT